MGMSCGRVSSNVEFGAGSSDRWIASADASSMRRERRVETEWSRIVITMTATSRKTSRLRRILTVPTSVTEIQL